MSDTQMPTDLQALRDELAQPETVRRERIRQQQFDERARQYAEMPQGDEDTYTDEQIYRVLVFRAGDERYGIEVEVVTGVRAVERITRVPGIPDFYRGVINMRGKIISVLDLRRFLGLPVSDDAYTEIVMVQSGSLTLALLAERVEDVARIPRQTVEAVDMRYARGVTARRLVILDTAYLFADERLIVGGKS
ncbi:MAG: chemotaxis protein CheW [Anaerolineae bacterium]